MNLDKALEIIILAAGKGTRMYSDKAKVLHKLGGKSLLQHVINTAKELNPQNIYVVYGHDGEQVKKSFSNEDVFWYEQVEQLGTGHAVQQVEKALNKDSISLILYGDVPLLSSATLTKLLEAKNNKTIALLTASLENPGGYGRIVRSDNKIEKIVEEKDADINIKKIKEINSGVMAVDSHCLVKWLTQINNNNSQQEFYLTDIIELAVSDNEQINNYLVDNNKEIEGINTKVQLAELEREYQKKQAIQLMQNGVTLADPARIDIRGSLQAGRDVSLDINVIIEGNCHIGNNVTIGANSIIKNSAIGDHVQILENCIIENSSIKSECTIGPFARLRPETHLAEKCKVGNFVEIKKSMLAKGSKVNHLSYVGDTVMGENVNVGAGTITCNYDGANKHVTTIGNNVFIGSNTSLVAPIELGDNATVGAGSTLNKNASADKLTVTRAKQTTIDGWKRPVK